MYIVYEAVICIYIYMYIGPFRIKLPQKRVEGTETAREQNHMSEASAPAAGVISQAALTVADMRQEPQLAEQTACMARIG